MVGTLDILQPVLRKRGKLTFARSRRRAVTIELVPSAGPPLVRPRRRSSRWRRGA